MGALLRGRAARPDTAKRKDLEDTKEPSKLTMMIPEDLHVDLKIACAAARTTMTAVAVEQFRGWLKAQKNGKND